MHVWNGSNWHETDMAAVFSNVCSSGAKEASNEQAHKSVSNPNGYWLDRV